MTSQEIFDTVAAHLLKQGKRAIANDGVCMYRAPDGCKCAFGCLIPDDLYSPPFENRLAVGVVNSCPELASLYDESTHSLLRDLQSMHDTCNPLEWADELRRLAHRHMLSDGVLK